MADPGSFAPDQPSRKGSSGPRPAGGWRTDPKAAGRGRGTMVAVILFMLVVVAGAAIGLLTWTSPGAEPVIVSLPVGELQEPTWPGVRWAEQDSDRLAVAARGRGDKELVTKAFGFQNREQLRQLIHWLSGEGTPPGLPTLDPKRPLVLHVTALAVAHGGTVYLLPADAKPADPAGWLPVSDLLDAMAKSGAKHKLLILDLAHPAADPFAGVLRDDVADHLDRLLGPKPPPFPVLTSCSPGELSLPSTSCSGFAKALTDGLHGSADGVQDQKPDDRVTVGELGQYVTDHVGKWAKAVHFRTQTPKVYGFSPDADFALTYPPAGRPQSEQPAEPAPPAPDWLDRGWQLRTEAKAAGADRGLPAPFARLTAGLVRAERARSGRADRAEGEWDAARKAWEEAVRDSGNRTPAADIYARASAPLARHRLAADRRGAKEPPDEWKTLLDRYVAAKVLPPAKPDPADDPKKPWLDATKANKPDAAWLVWQRAVSTPAPTGEQMTAWAEVAKELAPPRDYAELVLLAALADRKFRREQGLSAYPGAAVGEVLRTEHELGLALAGGPEGFALIRGRLDASETGRRDGQRKLLAAEYGPQVDAAVADLQTATDALRPAKDVLAQWQACNRELEAAAATLHDTLPAALEYDRPPFADWLTAARAATAVADLVSAGHGGSFDTVAAADRLPALRLATAPLARPSDEVVKKWLAAPRGTTTDTEAMRALAALRALAAGTALPADLRKAVKDALRADVDAREAKAGEDPGLEPTHLDQDDLGLRRAQASVELLRLAGYGKAGELERPLRMLEPDRRNVKTLREFGDQLATAWRAGLRQQCEAAEKTGRWHEVERIARAVPPAASVYPDGVPLTAGGRAAKARAVAEAAAYRDAVAARLKADGEARGFDPAAKTFYQKAADDWAFAK